MKRTKGPTKRRDEGSSRAETFEDHLPGKEKN